MVLHKICTTIDTASKSWQEYCLWRNYCFTDFQSLDSNLRGSVYEPRFEDDWAHTLVSGGVVTDVLNDECYALKVAARYSADEIINFEYLGKADPQEVIGFDILDGQLSYSLLTNFCNDVKIVNACLTRNGLIRHIEQAKQVHQWFLSNMTDDLHVIDSEVFAVYKPSLLRV